MSEKVLIWTMVYGTADAEECDAEDWVSYFHALDESDNCATDGVEFSDGRWVGRDEIRELPEFKAIDERDREAYSASDAASPTAIKLRHPHDPKRWAWYDRGPDDKMVQRAAELTERYGADRVSIWRRPDGRRWMEQS
jgi:hypothetical protein